MFILRPFICQLWLDAGTIGLVFITFGLFCTRFFFWDLATLHEINLSLLWKMNKVYLVKWDEVKEFSQFPVVLQPRPALPSEVPRGHAPSSHALFFPSRSAPRAKQEEKKEQINTWILITCLYLMAQRVSCHVPFCAGFLSPVLAL